MAEFKKYKDAIIGLNGGYIGDIKEGESIKNGYIEDRIGKEVYISYAETSSNYGMIQNVMLSRPCIIKSVDSRAIVFEDLTKTKENFKDCYKDIYDFNKEVGYSESELNYPSFTYRGKRAMTISDGVDEDIMWTDFGIVLNEVSTKVIEKHLGRLNKVFNRYDMKNMDMTYLDKSKVELFKALREYSDKKKGI